MSFFLNLIRKILVKHFLLKNFLLCFQSTKLKHVKKELRLYVAYLLIKVLDIMLQFKSVQWMIHSLKNMAKKLKLLVSSLTNQILLVGSEISILMQCVHHLHLELVHGGKIHFHTIWVHTIYWMLKQWLNVVIAHNGFVCQKKFTTKKMQFLTYKNCHTFTKLSSLLTLVWLNLVSLIKFWNNLLSAQLKLKQAFMALFNLTQLWAKQLQSLVKWNNLSLTLSSVLVVVLLSMLVRLVVWFMNMMLVVKLTFLMMQVWKNFSKN